jgi:hypothetical protein
MCSHSSADRGQIQGPTRSAGCERAAEHPLHVALQGLLPAGKAILAPLCARGGIGRRARLRALSCVNMVVVRVHSGA